LDSSADASIAEAEAVSRADWRFGALPMFGYDVIVADPPWDFENYSDAGTKKSADPHYDVMRLDEIKALPVGQLARGDCLLLLWTTGWAIATGQAQSVATAWDFSPVTEMIWRKITAGGKPRIGTGYRARTMHEPILLCTLGKPAHRPFPSLFDGVARQHSRKPDEFYDLVMRSTPLCIRRADLFSRQSRDGFDGWGDECGKFDDAAVV
jgi:N6-adenosine-specific RNA methylase IME4